MELDSRKMSKIKTEDKKFYDPNIDRKNKIYNDAFKITKEARPYLQSLKLATPAYVTGNVHFVREVTLAINM